MMRYVVLTVVISFFNHAILNASMSELEDFQSSQIETFDGVLGVNVSAGLLNGGMWGAPSAGLVLPSGLKFVLPDPNPPEGSDFMIGDFLFNSGGGRYGLIDNGSVRSAADLRGGTSLAGAGGNEPKSFEFTFEFPNPVRRFGVFGSAALGGAHDGMVYLTSIGVGGGTIETIGFQTNPIPFSDANFMGMSAAVPIEAFTISSISHFAFDDVIWNPVPEPTTCTLVLAALCLAMSRRRIAAR
jgi:hypothetical protein